MWSKSRDNRGQNTPQTPKTPNSTNFRSPISPPNMVRFSPFKDPCYQLQHIYDEEVSNWGYAPSGGSPGQGTRKNFSKLRSRLSQSCLQTILLFFPLFEGVQEVSQNVKKVPENVDRSSR